MTSVEIAQKFEELADGTDKENNYEKVASSVMC